MSAEISCVLFDLGGVLIEFAGFERLPEMLDERLDPEEVRRRWIHSPAVAQYERGQLESAAFAEAVAREWRLRVEPAVFLEHFVEWAKDFYPGARELVLETGRAVTTACFSNSNPLHWERNFRSYGIQDVFDRCFASYELGAVKPEARAFEMVLERLGLDGDRVLFLDDTEVNVEGARRAGLRAQRVRGVDQARAALVEAGLIAPGSGN
jgi:putative hydrolase of the HAD superfamily